MSKQKTMIGFSNDKRVLTSVRASRCGVVLTLAGVISLLASELIRDEVWYEPADEKSQECFERIEHDISKAVLK